MKNFLIAFLVFLVWSFFGLWLYSWLDPIKRANDPLPVVASALTDTAPTRANEEPLLIEDTLEFANEVSDTLSLSENIDEKENETVLPTGLKATTPEGDLLFLFDKGISISMNTSEIRIPTEILDFKYKLNTYFIEHPDEELHIASLYSPSENIVSPNFGIQRGKQIEEVLVATGIPRQKIVIKPVIREVFDINKEFNNGISFSTKPLDKKRVASIKLELPENRTIYPKLRNNDIFVNKALQDLLKEVKAAVTENPEIVIDIIGHTDNVGNANDNYLVGLKYARQVRWYLVTKGKVNRRNIYAKSEGESKSIASNKNKRGRFLNRRVEIRYRTR